MPTMQTSLRTLSLACLSLLMAQAQAQYKLVGPDGSVTYTDRPPANTTAKVTPLNKRGEAGAAAETAALPVELRATVARYPVTLYVSGDCAPCDNGRQFLQQRGIPFSEKRVASEEDALALERSVGARTVPALTIGTQALRGLSLPEWTAFLDAAGYPKESRLPRNFSASTATPLAERQPKTPTAMAPTTPVAATAPEPAASGLRIRF